MIDPKPADIGRKVYIGTAPAVRSKKASSRLSTIPVCSFAMARTRGRGRLGGRAWTGLRLVPIRQQASHAIGAAVLNRHNQRLTQPREIEMKRRETTRCASVS